MTRGITPRTTDAHEWNPFMGNRTIIAAGGVYMRVLHGFGVSRNESAVPKTERFRGNMVYTGRSAR